MSAGFDDGAVALLRRLGGRAEEFADALPGDALGAGCGDGVDDLSFTSGAGKCGAFEEVFLDRTLVGGSGSSSSNRFASSSA